MALPPSSLPGAFGGLAVVLSAGFLAGACTLSPSPQAQVPARQRGGVATNVSRFYNESCAHCHGERGQGGGAGTRTFLTRELYDQKYDRPFFDALKNGHKDMGMPGFGETLSDEEIWAQIVHIRELQSRAVGDTEPPSENGVVRSELVSYRVEPWSTGDYLLPWSMDWLRDGRALVTNRSGTMFIVSKDGKTKTPVTGLPQVAEIGQGGLMEIAVPPAAERAAGDWLYLSYTEPAANRPGAKDGGMTKIVRGKLVGTKWSDQQTIWEADPRHYTRVGIHFGSKIVFDGKGHVVFSVGERGLNEASRDPKNAPGKLYRLNLDGSAPKDNPTYDPASPKGIWTTGHRNPQGLAFDLDGRLWDTEHAPRGGDELNEIVKGGDYGWPLVGYGINYNDTPLHQPFPDLAEGALKNVRTPIYRWLPSTGASGLEVMRGPAFPMWKGDLIAGGLAGQNVDRIRTKDGKLVSRETLIKGRGRVRDLSIGPDGLLYIVLNDPDTIVRLVPVKQGQTK